MNYSKEEKKAINDLLYIVVTDIYDNEVRIDKTKEVNEYNHSVGMVLNLIKKQQAELENITQKYNNLKSYNKGTKEALRVSEELEKHYSIEASEFEAELEKKNRQLEEQKNINKKLSIENQKTFDTNMELIQENCKKDKIIDLALEYINHQIPATYREQKPYIFNNIEKILKGKELTDN